MTLLNANYHEGSDTYRTLRREIQEQLLADLHYEYARSSSNMLVQYTVLELTRYTKVSCVEQSAFAEDLVRFLSLPYERLPSRIRYKYCK